MPVVTPADPEDEDVARFVAALLREMNERYDDEDDPPAPTADAARFVLLVDDDDTPLGCGAVQPLSKSKPDAAPDHGEIKRVYIAPEARGRGLSRVLMDGLLELSRSLGYTWMQLETGDVQPEAIGLYESSGWARVPNYGQYEQDPRSICFGLRLDPERSSDG